MANAWLSGRTLAAFAGGTVAAIVASRLLPPIVAQGVGAARVAAVQDPFETLIEDHRHFTRLLEDMQRTDSPFQRTQLLLRLKRGITKHALAEEDVVYPMLHDHARGMGDAQHLYSEHAEIKMHLHRLEMIAKDDPRWVAEARELARTLGEHARHEEQVDFPRLREMLDDEELAHIARGVYREKAMVL